MVSFTPVHGITGFRYWCQKILPAVYDDSLSYYELLAKVVEKLNELIDVEEKQNIAITELQKWATEIEPRIKEYVFEYLQTNPQAQEAINQAIREYIDSVIVGRTYNELKDDGFLHS